MKLAIFDFDKTLLQVDTLPFLLGRWRSFGYSWIKYYKVFFSIVFLYIQYKTGITRLTKSEMKTMAIMRFNKVFKNMTEEQVKGFFDRCALETTDLLNLAVLNELKIAKKKGYHTVLLSGAHSMLITPIGRLLEMDTVIGTTMNFKDGIVDLDQELIITSGEKKLGKVKEVFGDDKINWKKSIALSDGYSDLSLLEAVGNPIAVNPDRNLKKTAKERSWRILQGLPRKQK